MAEPVIPVKAKLFIAALFTSQEQLAEIEKKLIKKFGDIDYRSRDIPFIHTDYYRDMGSEQKKVLMSFKTLIRRENIVSIKLFTNRIEKKFSHKGVRKVNIDPGYLTLSNVYLASCKEFFHRIYLQKGVYLENEYRYVGRQYEPWDWTYPDYRKPEYIFFFQEMRMIYYRQIRKK